MRTHESTELIKALGALRDVDGEVRREAVAVLETIGEPAMPHLIAALRDESPSVRQAAVKALRELKAQVAVPSLIAALREDADVSVRQAAATALAALNRSDESVAAALIAALHDESAQVREAAASALGTVALETRPVTITEGVVGRDAVRVIVTGDIAAAGANPEVRAASAYYTGVRLVEQGHWVEGLHLLEKSLAIRRQGDDLNARADTIYQIARTHHLMGNLEEARIRYRDALRLYERTGNRRGVAACKAGLGHLTIQIGWLDDAVHELEQAKQIYAELDDEQHVSEIEEVLHLANHIRERQPA